MRGLPTGLRDFQNRRFESFLARSYGIFSEEKGGRLRLSTNWVQKVAYLSSFAFSFRRGTQQHRHVVVVITLVNLIKDQVESLQKLGIAAVSLSDIADREARAMVVNKIDRPNTTPTVHDICTFAIYFSVF